MSQLNKRSWEEMELSDDEDVSMGRQVLPVASLPVNFDGVPTDGLQYLFTVRRDAQSLPNYTRVQNPFERMQAASEPGPSHRKPVALPSEEWRSTFVSRFRNLRKNSLQATIGVSGTPKDYSSELLPDKKERDHWWAFISGRPEYEWNPPKKPKKSKADRSKQRGLRAWSDYSPYSNGIESLQYEVPTQETYAEPHPEDDVIPASVDNHGESVRWLPDEKVGEVPSSTEGLTVRESSNVIPTAKMRLREPTPKILKELDNRYCMHLIMYFNHWIEQFLSNDSSSIQLISQSHGRWIFALLSRIDEHLTSDEISQLRNLARSCLSLIKHLRGTQVAVHDATSTDLASKLIDETSCWLVICAVCEFWRQRDLWTDAEVILSR